VDVAAVRLHLESAGRRQRRGRCRSELGFERFLLRGVESAL